MTQRNERNMPSEILGGIKYGEHRFSIYFLGILLIFLEACTPVRFSAAPKPTPKPTPCVGSSCVVLPPPPTTCTDKGCFTQFSQTLEAGKGIADILFVDDNSPSMSVEQATMAAHFPDFISSLSGIDYHIAITTTDVSSLVSNTELNPRSPINGYGAFQDGRLVEFTSGVSFLTPQTPNATDLFALRIVRNETIQCDASGFQESQCPSDDERGIFAANLTIQREAGANTKGFIRPEGPLNIVILSDEDERSGLYPSGPKNTNNRIVGWELQPNDTPAKLQSDFARLFPNKQLVVHSFIVIRGANDNCLNIQNAQGNGVRGSEGWLYQTLTAATGGVLGSICSSDYGRELRNIAYSIQNQAQALGFQCDPVDPDGGSNKYQITFEPASAASLVNYTVDLASRVVAFDRALPPGSRAILTYSCRKN